MDSGNVQSKKGDLSDYAPFPRPATPANRLIAAAAGRMAPKRIAATDLERWLEDSLRVYSTFSVDQDALERVRNATVWIVSDEPAPDDDVWSGEVVFGPDGPPAAICYSTTFASRLPTPLLELAWQGAMDHFVGHLYPYHRGAESPREYGEAAACRHQHRAAVARGRTDWRFRAIARVIPLIYRAHKGIPFSNYARRPTSTPANQNRSSKWGAER